MNPDSAIGQGGPYATPLTVSNFQSGSQTKLVWKAETPVCFAYLLLGTRLGPAIRFRPGSWTYA
ncbi:hypothetical protein CGRA01v4_11447 [Colletotrichum graminicola]|nr:hypothetical protein CGRA01v4_11447 [Colletotrichum graminicola]